MADEGRRVLVDTGAFAALANRSDEHRPLAHAIWDRLRREHLIPFTTNFIVAETHALLLARAGNPVARTWLRAQSINEMWVSETDYARGRQIVDAHRDKTYTLTDAISFAVMERLGARLVFSFDEHFEQYGFQRLFPQKEMKR